LETSTDLLWQVFKEATLFFSQATPSLATVIPAMDHIDETLTTQSRNPKIEPAIRVALNIAKHVLNQYYDKLDSLNVYRIAMGWSVALTGANC
jgi:hypothetical protein